LLSSFTALLLTILSLLLTVFAAFLLLAPLLLRGLRARARQSRQH
jgi:hypothetical protein